VLRFPVPSDEEPFNVFDAPEDEPSPLGDPATMWGQEESGPLTPPGVTATAEAPATAQEPVVSERAASAVASSVRSARPGVGRRSLGAAGIAALILLVSVGVVLASAGRGSHVRRHLPAAREAGTATLKGQLEASWVNAGAVQTAENRAATVARERAAARRRALRAHREAAARRRAQQRRALAAAASTSSAETQSTSVATAVTQPAPATSSPTAGAPSGSSSGAGSSSPAPSGQPPCYPGQLPC
jgi:hypothetical protein